MKNIEKFLYHAAAYTVVISLLFFLFARIASVAELKISLGRYLLIFSFSLIISASEFIFTFKKLNVFLKYLIHYITLSLGFFVIFLSIKSGSENPQFSPATIFAGLVIFSFVYFLILGAVLLIKRKFVKAEEKKSPEKKKSNYTPKFR